MTNKIIFFGTIVAAMLITGAIASGTIAFAADDDKKKGKKGKWLISESTILDGLAAGALFPYMDTTPNKIIRGHVALTDATLACDGDNANQPTNITLLVGVAGGVLTPATLENTGIGSVSQCVFHLTLIPGDNVPDVVTDIVVVNSGSSDLTGLNTITVSAEVRP